MIVWAVAWCRDKLGVTNKNWVKNRPLQQDNKTESECNGIFLCLDGNLHITGD